jgi:hypothetical protein
MLKQSGFQVLANSLVWDKGYTQVVGGPTRGDMLLDIYQLRPKSSFITCSIMPGISAHKGVLLEVDWDDNRKGAQVGRIVPLYHKTDVLGLQSFLSGKFKLWAGSGIVSKISGITSRILFSRVSNVMYPEKY